MSRRQSYATPTPAQRRASAIPPRLLADTPGPASRAATPSTFAPSPLSQGRKTKVKRLVKKRSLWSRLAEIPTAFLLDLSAEISLLDFGPLGWPAGTALNGIHALVRLSAWAPDRKSLRFWRKTATLTAAEERLRSMASSSRGFGISLGGLMSFLLVCLAFANALYLFTRSRRYQMWLRKDPLSSPNARLIEADVFSPRPSITARTWHFLKSFIITPAPATARQVTQLLIWNPPDLNLRIFCAYSPITALLWHFLDTQRAVVYLPVMGLCGFQTFWIVRVYEQTVKDRLLLHAEVANEYNEKLVRPRLFAYKRDVGTQTSQAEMIFPDNDWQDGSFRDAYASSASRRRTLA